MLVIAAVGLATAGIAGGALKTKKHSITLDPGQGGTVTAKCKRGTRAASGGFDGPDFYADPANVPHIQAFTSRRQGKRQWTSTGYSFLTGNPETPPGDLLTFVYCSDDLPRLKTRSAATTISSVSGVQRRRGVGEVGSAIARCKQGEEAVAGGFSAPNDAGSGVYASTSRRAGKRGWLAAGRSSTPDPLKLTSYVYCAKHELGLKVKKSAPASTSESAATLSGTARCKRGSEAISGGFEAALPDVGFDSAEVFESRRAGKRGWRASADASGDEFGVECLHFVVAEFSSPLVASVTVSLWSATVTIANGAVGTATARCPRGGEAVSGGFSAGVADTHANALVFVFESRRNGKRGWAVSGETQTGANAGEALDLTAFAYCAKPKLGLKTRSADASTVVDGSEISAEAKCKRRQVAVSGGFSSNPEPFSQPFESRRAGRRGWVASIGAYPTPGVEDTLDVFAYCLEKEKK